VPADVARRERGRLTALAVHGAAALRNKLSSIVTHQMSVESWQDRRQVAKSGDCDRNEAPTPVPTHGVSVSAKTKGTSIRRLADSGVKHGIMAVGRCSGRIPPAG
jgi:hypothetical protein